MPSHAPPKVQRAVGLVVLLLLGALLAVGLTPRAPLPLGSVERARAALRRARVEAAGRADGELARAIAAGERLERRLAETRSARFPAAQTADGRAIEELAESAEAAAALALQSAWRDLERRHGETSRRRAEIDQKLTALDGALGPLPADRGLRVLWQRARLEAESAGQAESRGDFAAAAQGLDSAARELAAVEDLTDRHYARLHDPALRRRWQGWMDEAVALSRAAGTAVVVDKLSRRCLLLAAGRLVASYPAELGRDGLAEKLYAGDAATPEGRYRVIEKRDVGATLYHRALLLDYPTDEDRRQFDAARRRGLVPGGRGIGGLIEIHGHGGKWINWTNGCVALRDPHMDRLFAAVAVGTPVTIVGTAAAPGAADAEDGR